MIKQILHFIHRTGKKHINICDVWGGYWYDNTFIRKMVSQYFADVTIEVDLFDPDINFYRDTVHHKQEWITYYDTSFLTIDLNNFREKYDIVICSEVVEHLRWPEQEMCFAQFNNVLSFWWLLLVTTPNGSSIVKTLYWLLQRKKWEYDTFMSEHNHRYAHIGISTLFQVLWLCLRKWFEVQKIIPSTITSGILVSPISITCNYLFHILVGINLFISTDNVYVATKIAPLDTSKRYNTLELTL